MKNLLIMILFSGLHLVGMAQCEDTISEKKMEKGMLILAEPNNNRDKSYVAEVIGVNDTDFSCRFLHSNSLYEFVDLKIKSEASSSLLEATVKSNIGGSYGSGTVFIVNVFMPDPDYCDLSDATGEKPYKVIATFPDSKRYLGNIRTNDEGYEIFFFIQKVFIKQT